MMKSTGLRSDYPRVVQKSCYHVTRNSTNIQFSVVQLHLTYAPFYKNVTTCGPLAISNKMMYESTDAKHSKLKTGR